MRAHLLLIVYKEYYNKRIKQELEAQVNDDFVIKYNKRKYWKDSRMVTIDAEIKSDTILTEQEWKDLFRKR